MIQGHGVGRQPGNCQDLRSLFSTTRTRRLCLGDLKEPFKCPCLFPPLCNVCAAEGQGAGNHGSGAESCGEEVVFKWGGTSGGRPPELTLQASSELFVHSAYLGREAEFFPAGKQALQGKVLPDSIRRGCVPGSRFWGLCLKTLVGRELRAPWHEQDRL